MPMYKVVEHYAVKADSREEAVRLVGRFNCDIVYYKEQEWLRASDRALCEVCRIYLDVKKVV